MPGALLVLARGDPDIKLIRSTLRKVGFTVVTVEGALEISKTSSDPLLRLVVADPATPGFDFAQLLKTLEETGSCARVLCLGEEGGGDAASVSKYAKYISGHLSRPFRRAHLLASILDAMERPLARTA